MSKQRKHTLTVRRAATEVLHLYLAAGKKYCSSCVALASVLKWYFTINGRQNTEVTNSINGGSVPFRCARGIVSQHTHYESPGTGKPSWTKPILVLLHLWCSCQINKYLLAVIEAKGHPPMIHRGQALDGALAKAAWIYPNS